MNDTQAPGIRINKLYIKNYEAIDELEIEFPKPRMDGDPDIFILGSRNGVGKTSVLECCSLSFFLYFFGKGTFNLFQDISQSSATDSLIRLDEETTHFKIYFEIAGAESEIGFKIEKGKQIDTLTGKNPSIEDIIPDDGLQ